jgi:hypothetical protein
MNGSKEVLIITFEEQPESYLLDECHYSQKCNSIDIFLACLNTVLPGQRTGNRKNHSCHIREISHGSSFFQVSYTLFRYFIGLIRDVDSSFRLGL